jgi:hypothetical protein
MTIARPNNIKQGCCRQHAPYNLSRPSMQFSRLVANSTSTLSSPIRALQANFTHHGCIIRIHQSSGCCIVLANIVDISYISRESITTYSTSYNSSQEGSRCYRRPHPNGTRTECGTFNIKGHDNRRTATGRAQHFGKNHRVPSQVFDHRDVAPGTCVWDSGRD